MLIHMNKLDKLTKASAQVDVAAQKLTITCFWDEPGLLDGWRHLWSEHFLFETPSFGHIHVLIELIMSGTPSVQISTPPNPIHKLISII